MNVIVMIITVVYYIIK